MAERKRDYYQVLGLQKGASDTEIKKAFRKLAKESHPDVNPGNQEAEARFKELNEAYEVLSDPEKKAKYDQFGHAGVDPNFGASGGPFGGSYGGMDFDLGDIFNTFFGGSFGGAATGRRGPRKGEDIRVNLNLSFVEAAFGCEKELSIPTIVSCDPCEGVGAEKGSTPETCSKCRGTGTVNVQRRTAFGVMNTSSPCQPCSGTGKIIQKPCTTCKGKGKLRKTQKISVKIPAGIDDGQIVSISGKGNVGTNGGPAGDVLVAVNMRPHETFERDGYSVLSRVRVSVVQAMLGDELEVETLDGKVKYTMPDGTQSGTVFRLKGRGVPYLNSSGRGDHYITVIVDIPGKLNQEQRELLTKFGESLGESVTAKQGFFEKRKKKK